MSSTGTSPAMTDHAPDAQPPVKASVWRVVKDQRKVCYVALAMMVASFWIIGQLGRWQLAGCIAGGVAVIFWPDGIGLLLGLAVFRLIALVMTTIPLLKELKNQ